MLLQLLVTTLINIIIYYIVILFSFFLLNSLLQYLNELKLLSKHCLPIYFLDGTLKLIYSNYMISGRNLTGIRISRGSGRPAFFLEGGQIGADWLSPTVLTYFIDQLVQGEDPEARAASNDFDWHIFPIVNPDGHEFTQDSVSCSFGYAYH